MFDESTAGVEPVLNYARTMLLDRAFRFVFRNFSTLFLLVAAVTVTTHLIYGFVYREVLEVTELHPFIEGLSPGRYVKGVGAKELEGARTAGLVLALIQVALLPLLIGATRRIFERDGAGAVPTVVDALTHVTVGPRLALGRPGRWGVTALLGLLVGAAVWWLSQKAGLVLAEAVPNDLNFIAFGLVRGIALALGAPFFLAGIVVPAATERQPEGVRSSA